MWPGSDSDEWWLFHVSSSEGRELSVAAASPLSWWSLFASCHWPSHWQRSGSEAFGIHFINAPFLLILCVYLSGWSALVFRLFVLLLGDWCVLRSSAWVAFREVSSVPNPPHLGARAIAVLDQHFADPRKKLPMLPTKAQTWKLYEDLLRWPKQYRSFFLCSDAARNCGSSCTSASKLSRRRRELLFRSWRYDLWVRGALGPTDVDEIHIKLQVELGFAPFAFHVRNIPPHQCKPHRWHHCHCLFPSTLSPQPRYIHQWPSPNWDFLPPCRKGQCLTD